MRRSDYTILVAIGLSLFGVGVFLFDNDGLYPKVWGATLAWKAAKLAF